MYEHEKHQKNPKVHKLMQYWFDTNGYTPVNRQISLFIITVPQQKRPISSFFELVLPLCCQNFKLHKISITCGLLNHVSTQVVLLESSEKCKHNFKSIKVS